MTPKFLCTMHKRTDTILPVFAASMFVLCLCQKQKFCLQFVHVFKSKQNSCNSCLVKIISHKKSYWQQILCFYMYHWDNWPIAMGLRACGWRELWLGYLWKQKWDFIPFIEWGKLKTNIPLAVEILRQFPPPFVMLFIPISFSRWWWQAWLTSKSCFSQICLYVSHKTKEIRPQQLVCAVICGKWRYRHSHWQNSHFSCAIVQPAANRLKSAKRAQNNKEDKTSGNLTQTSYTPRTRWGGLKADNWKEFWFPLISHGCHSTWKGKTCNWVRTFIFQTNFSQGRGQIQIWLQISDLIQKVKNGKVHDMHGLCSWRRMLVHPSFLVGRVWGTRDKKKWCLTFCWIRAES